MLELIAQNPCGCGSARKIHGTRGRGSRVQTACLELVGPGAPGHHCCVADVGKTGCEASGTAFSQAVAPEDARPSWSCFGSAIRCHAAGMHAGGVLVF